MIIPEPESPAGGRDLPSLGYEPYDVRLSRLGVNGASPVSALTSAYGWCVLASRLLRLPRLNPSRSVRFTNRLQNRFLTCGADGDGMNRQAGVCAIAHSGRSKPHRGALSPRDQRACRSRCCAARLPPEPLGHTRRHPTEERWDDFHYVSTPAWRRSSLGPAGTPLAVLKTHMEILLNCVDAR